MHRGVIRQNIDKVYIDGSLENKLTIDKMYIFKWINRQIINKVYRRVMIKKIIDKKCIEGLEDKLHR